MIKFYLEVFWVWLGNLFVGQNKFNPDYNSKIGKWLDEGKGIVVGKHTSTINGFTVWTSNYPYSYGNAYKSNLSHELSKEFGLSAFNIVRLERRVRDIKSACYQSEVKEAEKRLMKEIGDL